MRGLWRAITASPVSILLTIAVIWLVGDTVWNVVQWGLVDGVFHGDSGRACRPDGACWAFLGNRGGLLLFGPYPPEERWRVILSFVIGLAGIGVLVAPKPERKIRFAAWFLLIYPIISFILIRGGIFGLPGVISDKWGGVMLTLVIAGWTIVTAMPFGMLLAFCRRSKLPVIHYVAVFYIDIMRGLPLIGVLFVAIVMFPLFMPPGMDIDKLMRAAVAFTLFNGANFAEMFRGGLQAIPSGQIEGAAALGLRRWHTTFFVVIPQVISVTLPGLVNISASIIKESTLVLIVGLYDLLGVIQAGTLDPNWLMSDQVRITGYFFSAITFWTLCFGLSRYGAHIERRMKAGAR